MANEVAVLVDGDWNGQNTWRIRKGRNALARGCFVERYCNVAALPARAEPHLSIYSALARLRGQHTLLHCDHLAAFLRAVQDSSLATNSARPVSRLRASNWNKRDVYRMWQACAAQERWKRCVKTGPLRLAHFHKQTTVALWATVVGGSPNATIFNERRAQAPRRSIACVSIRGTLPSRRLRPTDHQHQQRHCP